MRGEERERERGSLKNSCCFHAGRLFGFHTTRNHADFFDAANFRTTFFSLGRKRMGALCAHALWLRKEELDHDWSHGLEPAAVSDSPFSTKLLSPDVE